MGINRYVSRRYITVLKYLLFAGFVYILYGTFFASTAPQSKDIFIGRAARIEAPAPPVRVFPKQSDGVDPFLTYKNEPKKNWENLEEYAADQGSCWARWLLYKANGYNAYVSDLISLNRSMKDIRHPQCKRMEYHSKLPMVSVIFPMHEEHNSTLLRSVYSIMNRSPKELLKEIILVDDFSEKPFLKKPLEDFLKHEKIDHIVKVLRTKKREGLIRARQLGAEKATGDILVFLDSHSEANYNWLPPLIDPIVEDYRFVVLSCRCSPL
ncbi:hypothetical protein COOONC_23415 [Cooperia oncophora]